MGASFGANDIYIGSPTGTLYLHYGAGGVPCSYPPYWTTINGFFAFTRASYLRARGQNFDFHSFPLPNARFTNVGATRQIRNGYFRQVPRFQGAAPTAGRSRGRWSSTCSPSTRSATSAVSASRSAPHPPRATGAR